MPPFLAAGGAALVRIVGCSKQACGGSTLFESAGLQSIVFGHGTPPGVTSFVGRNWASNIVSEVVLPGLCSCGL